MNKENSFNFPAEFWHFLSAKLFFVLGVRIISSVVIYQTFKLANTYMVGVVGLTEFLPAVLTAMYAGHYIDNNNKKKILSVSFFSYFLCAILLAAISNSTFNLSTNSKILFILFAVFASGIIRSFGSPASNSMIPAIVPKDTLQKAVSLNSSVYLTSSIIGHATGGLLIAAIGISYAYAVAATLLFIAFILSQKIKSKPPIIGITKEPVLQSIKQGFSFVWKTKPLLGVITLDLFAVLFGGAVAFIPEIAENVLHTDARGYGFLNAAMDIGALVSVLLFLWFPMKKKQGLKMLLAVAGFGIFIIIFGLSKVYWLSFVALACAGVCDGLSVVVRGMISQLYTPDELRGRVSSINGIFINSSNELGQFESGFTSKLMGTIPAVIFGGAMSILVVAATWFKFPDLKKIE